MTALAIAFIIGWAACILFIAAWEVIAQLRERRRQRLYLEEIAVWEPVACPWPEKRSTPKLGGGSAERRGRPAALVTFALHDAQVTTS